MASLGIPDPTHVKLHHRLVVLIDTYLHTKTQLYNCDSFWDIEVWKTCNLVGREHFFLYLTREPDFYQTCGFNSIIKVIMVHDLNPKIYTSMHYIKIYFLQNPKNAILGMFLGIIPKMRYFPKDPALSVFYP